jgi:hypothetical protein
MLRKKHRQALTRNESGRVDSGLGWLRLVIKRQVDGLFFAGPLRAPDISSQELID